MSLNAYCPSCGQNVELDTKVEGGYLLESCSVCGLGLGVRVLDDLAESAGELPPDFYDDGPSLGLGKLGVVRKAITLVPIIEMGHPSDPRADRTPTPLPTPIPKLSKPVSKMSRVYVVDDSALLRMITRELLEERGLVEEVVECGDGTALVEQFTADLLAGTGVDLVILDVLMPELDGREAAFALRALEAGFQVKRTPILFFSQVLCDADMKRLLRQLCNARYIRKPTDGDEHELGGRLVAVLERLVGVMQTEERP